LLITAVLFRNVDLLLASGGDRLYQQMPRQAREGLMDSISVGLGSYMSIFISAYFAFVSVKHFRESKDNKGEEVGQLQKAAA
jgi:hypothetical protein